MHIRTHPPMTFLYTTHQARLTELANFAGKDVKELYKHVVDLDLLICGPAYWFYYGADGRPDTIFTLEIGFPVQGRIPATMPGHFKELPAFRCLSTRHVGPWEKMSRTYGEMMEYISENGLTMNGISSECYLHLDFFVPENNITEIQIGII